MSAGHGLLRAAPVAVPVPVAARVREAASASGWASPAPLRLHVERLVLHGLPLAPRDASRVERAFQRELEQRVAARPQGLRLGRLGGGAVDALRLDPLDLGAARRIDAASAGFPEQLGCALAQALWQRLERGLAR